MFLSKDADLTVYLLGASGEPIYLAERQQDVLGRTTTGVICTTTMAALISTPTRRPTARIRSVAFARDAVGQEIQRTASLTIEQGGKPYAQIIPQPTGATVIFETRRWEDRFLTARDHPGDLITTPDDPAALNMNDLTLTVGDLLVFKLSVENYGDVPICTTGPAPGTVYEWDQRASTLGTARRSRGVARGDRLYDGDERLSLALGARRRRDARERYRSGYGKHLSAICPPGGARSCGARCA